MNLFNMHIYATSHSISKLWLFEWKVGEGHSHWTLNNVILVAGMFALWEISFLFQWQGGLQCSIPCWQVQCIVICGCSPSGIFNACKSWYCVICHTYTSIIDIKVCNANVICPTARHTFLTIQPEQKGEMILVNHFSNSDFMSGVGLIIIARQHHH